MKKKDECAELTDEQAQFLVEEFYNQLSEKMFTVLVNENSEQFIDEVLSYFSEECVNHQINNKNTVKFEESAKKVIQDEIENVVNELTFRYVEDLAEKCNIEHCGDCESCDSCDDCHGKNKKNKLN